MAFDENYYKKLGYTQTDINRFKAQEAAQTAALEKQRQVSAFQQSGNNYDRASGALKIPDAEGNITYEYDPSANVTWYNGQKISGKIDPKALMNIAPEMQRAVDEKYASTIDAEAEKEFNRLTKFTGGYTLEGDKTGEKTFEYQTPGYENAVKTALTNVYSKYNAMKQAELLGQANKSIEGQQSTWDEYATLWDQYNPKSSEKATPEMIQAYRDRMYQETGNEAYNGVLGSPKATVIEPATAQVQQPQEQPDNQQNQVDYAGFFKKLYNQYTQSQPQQSQFSFKLGNNELSNSGSSSTFSIGSPAKSTLQTGLTSGKTTSAASSPQAQTQTYKIGQLGSK